MLKLQYNQNCLRREIFGIAMIAPTSQIENQICLNM